MEALLKHEVLCVCFFALVLTNEGGGWMLEMHINFPREKEETEKKSELGQNR